MTGSGLKDRPVDASTPYSAWIVVLTKGQCERPTKAQLEAQGFEVYLPMRPVRHRFGGVHPVPLFPRYLFVRITREACRWQALFGTRGVTRVMCTMQRPIGVRNEFIEKVRAQELKVLEGFGAEGAAAAVSFKPGDRVVTLDGLVQGIFQEDIDGRRVAILISLIGGDSRIATVDMRKLAHPQSVAS